MNDPVNSLTEIRNAIYKVICDRPQPRLTYEHRYLLRRTSLKFLQLAHVNQQIRWEFLPLYIEGVLKSQSQDPDQVSYGRLCTIRFRDAYYLLRDFIYPYIAPNALRTLFLDVSCWYDFNGTPPNILPFLYFYTANPGTNVVLCNHPDDSSARILVHLINELTAETDTAARLRWTAYMNEHVDKIYVTYGDILHVEIAVKRAAAELWMGKDCGKIPRNAWLEETGFPLSVPRGPLFPALEWTVGVVGLSR